MKNKFKLNASTLRIVLSASILIIVSLSGAVFVYGRHILTAYAIEVSHKKVDADASNGSIQALKEMEQALAKNQDVQQTMASLKASNELPQFRIVDDVTKYADKNHISISSFDFAEATAATAATPAAPGSSAAPITTAGSTSVSIIVTLGSPLNYSDLLQFMHDIEQNVPKMQISGIDLSADAASGGGVTSAPLTIQMYTK